MIRWPAKDGRDLTAKECRAGLALLESKAGRQWSKKWGYGDPEEREKIAELITALEDGALVRT